MDSIKDVVQSSVKVPRVRQTPEEGQRTYWLKYCGNNNKDEDNGPKTPNDKNHHASSQKFRQLILIKICMFGLVWFYGTSTTIGYSVPNPFYTYKQFYFKQFNLV